MNKVVALSAAIVATGVVVILSFSAPWVLSDNNAFLKGFVNHELLAFLGVVVTITLASAANLHIELNKMEDRVDSAIFTKTKASIKQSAAWLIGLLVIAIALIVSKSLVVQNDTSMSLVNGAALLVVLFNILILIDLTMAAFSLDPKIKKDDDS